MAGPTSRGPSPGAGLPSPDGGDEPGTTEALFGVCRPRRLRTRDRCAITNTTIGVVATNAAVDKVGCHHLARAAHDGLARAITPPHLSVDGDAFVALSSPHGPDDVPLDRLRLLTVDAVDRAIRSLGVIAGPEPSVRRNNAGTRLDRRAHTLRGPP